MEKIKYLILFIIIIAITTITARKYKKVYNNNKLPEISFEFNHFDMDTINTAKEAEVYFVYSNIGNSNLKIDKIETTCGCTIPKWNNSFLASKRIDSFKVTYNTENKGHFIKEIAVYSNSKNSPNHLKISGYVPFE